MVAACLAWAEPTRRLALMVGVNDGGRDRVRLQYAVSDAAAFAGSMQELGGVDIKDVTILRDIPAHALDAAFESLRQAVLSAKQTGVRIEVIVFYSGHADEKGLLLGGQHYAFSRFRDKVDQLPAEVRIAIVDACASGTLIKRKGGRTVPAFLADASVKTTGYAFLTSSSSDEAAQESDRIRASYFSHYLITGLRGAADASQDGRITLHEAYDYAYRETLAQTESSTAGPQHASYDMSLTGSGDVVMTELGRAQATLTLPDSIHGRFFIRDMRSRLVAEVQKSADKPLHFALEPGQYSVHWHHQGRIRVGNLIVKKGDAAQVLVDATWKEQSKEFAVARGGSAKMDSDSGNDLVSGNDFADGFESGEWGGNLDEESHYRFWSQTAENDFRGMQFTWGVNRAERRFEGEQFAFIANSANSSVNGVQAGGLSNMAKGQLRGGQVSSFGNIALDDVRGLQFSGGFNYARSMSQGVQASDFFNYLGGSGTGVQFSPAMNWTRGSFSGFQGGMGLNYVGSHFRGTQFFSCLNWVAGTVDGNQFGIINVAKAYQRGTPVGLLNFVGNGTWRGETWMEETGMQYYGLLSGSRRMNTRIALGHMPFVRRDLGSLAIEAAGHFDLTHKPLLFIEPGLMTSLVGAAEGHEGDTYPDFLHRARFSLGVDLGPYLSVAAGASWAVLFTPSYRAPLVGPQWEQRNYYHHRIHTWPGLHVSVRVGTYGKMGPHETGANP